MSPSRLAFQLEAQATDSRARAATFHTLHGTVRTPLFMPVGTQATVKAQLPETLHESCSQILLANTYHLLLRPGPEVFKKMGGIQKFMNWPGSVLTDSGGYQIFSLPHSRSMTEAGAVFQSYVDGQRILLSPELSIQTQMAIGSDIMMVLDQCIPSTADEAAARTALQVTQRWAVRSLAAREDSPQSMFAIVQGALYPHLRRESADGLMQLPFDGFAIGGLAVGEDKAEREDTCELTACLLPEDRPRYLMGVGTPLDILEAVHRGVDMFDCIIPTQVAKRGSVFTSRGIVQLRRTVYKFSEDKLDPNCTCPVCAKYSRAYLHHLTKTQEPLGWQLMGQHNIHFYHQLMREIRQSILEDRFLPLYQEKRQILQVEDIDHPITTTKPPVISPDHAQRVGDREVAVEERRGLGPAADGQEVDDLDEEPRAPPAPLANDLHQLAQARHEAVVADPEERAAWYIADARRFHHEDTWLTFRKPGVPVQHVGRHESLVGRPPGDHRRDPRALVDVERAERERREEARPRRLLARRPAGRGQRVADARARVRAPGHARFVGSQGITSAWRST